MTDRRTRQQYRDLLRIESGADVGDTYTYAAPPGGHVNQGLGRVAIRALATGPLVAALELRSEFQAGRAVAGQGQGSVRARLILSLFAGSPALRCTLEIHNRARSHRLRVRVRSDVPGTSATAGAQFGMTARAPVAVPAGRYPRERPALTAPAHRFVACAAKNRGLALLTPGFFEYELQPNGDLLMTLLRAVGQLSRADLSTRPGHAGWPVATPAAQCLGRDRLQFALAPVTRAELDRGTPLTHLWEDLFLPPRAVWLRQASPLTLPSIDIRLEGEGLVFSAVKPAERGAGLVLRCYNATGEPAAGVWHVAAVIGSAQRARADEQVLHDIRLGEGSRSIPFHAAAHEIVTIVVTLGKPD